MILSINRLLNSFPLLLFLSAFLCSFSNGHFYHQIFQNSFFQTSMCPSPHRKKTLRSQMMRATLLVKSSLYFIFSPGSPCSINVYRCESGKCHTLPFFLTIFNLFINSVVQQFSQAKANTPTTDHLCSHARR